MTYKELIKRLKDKAEEFDYHGWVDTAIILEQAADAIEELVNFIMHFSDYVPKPNGETPE